MAHALPDDLAAALENVRVDLRFFPEVDSTNDLALELADDGAADGVAVLANAQRAGRGRRGRVWFSPPGAGLYLSVVVRSGEPGSLALLTLAAGVASAEAVRGVTGLPVELKWPNDLVVGRPWRKLAGILCESMGSRLDTVVVGIGINLLDAAYPPDLRGRATSIASELGRPVDRGPVVAACLIELKSRVMQLRQGEEAAVLDAWRRLGAAGLDRAPVRWQDQGSERRGRACGIDDAGALLVEAGGRIERIIAGEVTWDRTI